MKFQVREHQKFLSTTPMVGKSSRRPTSDPFLIKQQNVLLPYIKQNNQERVVQTINSFSLQEAFAGVSVEEIVFAVKETSNKKDIWNKE